MTHARRGRGSYRGVYLGAAAALGFALSGCGGGSAGSSAAAAAAQGPASTQSSASTPSLAQTGPAPSQGTSSSGGTPTAGTGTGTGTGSASGSAPAASYGTVTINWVAPTQNVDGSTLTNLSGYTIHYGTQSNNYTQAIKVSNPGLATYVVDGLSPGTYYFSVSAYNSTGVESPLSSEVKATVN